MPDPKQQAETQLLNIESSSGRTRQELVAAVEASELRKHGQIVAYLKDEFELTHGNANLVAHLAIETMAGGPAPDDELLEAQYAGARAALRPVYDVLAEIAERQGDDVDKVIQKTGVSFRRRKQFALVQAASSKRVALGLNLGDTPAGGRVKAVSGMCTHRVDIHAVEEVDDEVAGWLGVAYDAAG